MGYSYQRHGSGAPKTLQRGTDAPMTTDALARRMRACTLCADLPLGPKPLFRLSAAARILIAGQAPGRKTHENGRPFDDVSGDRLRDWMGIDRDSFYTDPRLAILPMGLCYPGTGKSGDKPPRAECAPAWRSAALSTLGDLKLTLVIGRYAMDWHLPDHRGQSIASVAGGLATPDAPILLLPHPSPRNNRWLTQNPWFEAEILPLLRRRISTLLS